MAYELLYCIDMKEYDKLKEIIVKTSSVDLDAVMVNDYCPLHYCIYKTVADDSYERFVDLLFKLKAGVNARDGDGKTPLYYAVRYGLTNICKKLLARGATPSDTQNDREWACLHFAAVYGYNEIISLILNKDRRVVNQRNEDGETALHLAAEHGQTSTVELLLSRGGSPHVKNLTQGYTALHKASVHGYMDTAVILIKKGSSIHEADNSPLRKSPLQIASDLGWFGCAALMDVTHNTIKEEAAKVEREKLIARKKEEAKKKREAIEEAKREEKKRLRRLRKEELERKKKERLEKKKERLKLIEKKRKKKVKPAVAKEPQFRTKFDAENIKKAQDRLDKEANRDARAFSIDESRSSSRAASRRGSFNQKSERK
eukprot:g6016.t1